MVTLTLLSLPDAVLHHSFSPLSPSPYALAFPPPYALALTFTLPILSTTYHQTCTRRFSHLYRDLPISGEVGTLLPRPLPRLPALTTRHLATIPIASSVRFSLETPPGRPRVLPAAPLVRLEFMSQAFRALWRTSPCYAGCQRRGRRPHCKQWQCSAV